MPELPGLWSLSPLAALVGFIVLLGYMLAKGKLRTEREVADIVAQHQAQLGTMRESHEGVLAQMQDRLQEYKDREGKLAQRGDDWKAAYQSSEQASTELREQVYPLVAEVGRTTKHVIEQLPTPTNGGHTGGQES